MICFPHAKINLGLNVLRKRADGFHGIRSHFYPVPVCDVLEAIPSDKLHIRISGIDIPGSAEENMCLKAWRVLEREYGIGAVRFHLHKVIPTGAGLGGGSSDASFTFKLLDRIFHLQLPETELSRLALNAGSDCPFFMQDKPAFVTGRGEIIQPSGISLQGYRYAIICPGIHISTAAAYQCLDAMGIDLDSNRSSHLPPISEWKSALVNDFEKFAMQKYPVLQNIKDKLYSSGAIYASLSGSGSSVFGIFRHAPDIIFPEEMKVFSGVF